jgi:hypothetical protein
MRTGIPILVAAAARVKGRRRARRETAAEAERRSAAHTDLDATRVSSVRWPGSRSTTVGRRDDPQPRIKQPRTYSPQTRVIGPISPARVGRT